MLWNTLSIQKKLWFVILIPFLFMIALAVVSLLSLNRINQNAGWVSHTYRVLEQAQTVVTEAVNMETGMRGFLLSGQDNFLEPYRQGESAVYRLLADLQQTVSDNPPQVARLRDVETVLRTWQRDVTEPAIALRRAIGDADTMNDLSALVAEARGKTFFDAFRGQVATFIERERVLLVGREAEFAALLDAASVDSTVADNTISWVTHTYRVIGQAQDIIAAAVDMETGMRGFLLAGREEFLEPYDSGSARFFALTEALRETVSDNPPQVELLFEIDETIATWNRDVVEPMIALRRMIGDAKTMDDMADLVGEARGKIYFDEFRAIMRDFVNEEAALLDVREEQRANIMSFAWIAIVTALLLGGLIGAGSGWRIGGGVSSAIQQMTQAMTRLAGGDKGIDVPGMDRGDEIGSMAKAVEVFRQNRIEADALAEQEAAEVAVRQRRTTAIETLTHDFEIGVEQDLQTVTGAAAAIDNTALTLSDLAADTSTRSTDVSRAANQASNNVQSVASAAEELSASIREISEQAARSSEIAARAATQSSETDQQVRGLAEASKRIGEVVSLISDIAEQTNLLALNATIEAARAGDAGKGFAVVASEVKSLATQTAQATDEIRQQIGTVQSETDAAVAAIQAIGTTIETINDMSSGIAAAVEQQGAATAEISRNVQEALNGTALVSENIDSVDHSAGKTRTAVDALKSNASEMNDRAEALRSMIERFLGDVRAA